jgi:hypothetical protein
MVELGRNVFFGAIGLAFILLCVFLGWKVLAAVLRHWRTVAFLVGAAAFLTGFVVLLLAQLKWIGDPEDRWWAWCTFAACVLSGIALMLPFFWGLNRYERGASVFRHFDGKCPTCGGSVESSDETPAGSAFRCESRPCRLWLAEWHGELPKERPGPWWLKVYRNDINNQPRK